MTRPGFEPSLAALRRATLAALAAAALATPLLLAGCAPLLMGGAMMGTALSVTDRRSSGAQVEDQAIELKSISRLRDGLGDRGHVSITSFNRIVLLTGEVASEADRKSAEQVVAAIDNVRGTVNELAVMGSSSITSRSSDAVLTSKVKAAYFDTKDLQANVFKVVTERSVVYLMGIVSEREAARAAEVARGVGGVAKVVRVFEVISEAELARLQPPPSGK